MQSKYAFDPHIHKENATAHIVLVRILLTEKYAGVELCFELCIHTKRVHCDQTTRAEHECMCARRLYTGHIYFESRKNYEQVIISICLLKSGHVYTLKS